MPPVNSPEVAKPVRLMSLDAYRGFIMLAMVSGGFGFSKIYKLLTTEPERLSAWYADGHNEHCLKFVENLAYQFDHVAWIGCGFWDLIQPAFMFMVGVAMPFSYSRREAEGQSRFAQFGHVLFRSLVLVLLGVFLSSNWSKQTNFTFVNVLSQIGLGYPFVYLLLGRKPAVQMVAVAAILGGYWYYFYQYTISPEVQTQVATYLAEVKKPKNEPPEMTGIAAHWNKHTNAAAAADRKFLNLFPRDGEEWQGKKFWVNDGGYQTLNFVPSMATILLGLLAGGLLRGSLEPAAKFKRLIIGGVVCFVLGMACDTNIWPVQIAGVEWSVCPVVKRIWTPSWALFSTGWTLWMLAAFYWVIDIQGWKKWAFPLVVVGMNSIAIYCMSQMLGPWVNGMLKTHLTTLDQLLQLDKGITYYLFNAEHLYSPIWQSLGKVVTLWLACWWMFRQKIFVRI